MTLECLDCQCFNFCREAKPYKEYCDMFTPISGKEDKYMEIEE